MATLFISTGLENYAKLLYKLVKLLGNPKMFIDRCQEYGWRINEELSWVPAVDFSIQETDTFSLNRVYAFSNDEPHFAQICICAITYYDEETNLQLSTDEVKELDIVFDKAYHEFLIQFEFELGKASRHETYTISDRKLNYSAWEQEAGFLILNQTLGDLHNGIDWEIHISLYTRGQQS